ncbi:hypothetical protein M3201_11870 [Paenibacillus motobuensis]|uniref:hypothetical protein n=1 Tax=Paenibacillus TaxID=44249 RepID=UPI00203CA7A9|nr:MULTISPECIES: hypothetical protein [Paenibacillus]MCM3040396.1 hypothetical protein [Paenibacillus lutimineralis]MCM3647500.1 hypothetical protein [Paenibacillus motobuensis]
MENIVGDKIKISHQSLKKKRKRNKKLIRSKRNKPSNTVYNAMSFYTFLKKSKFNSYKRKIKYNQNGQVVIKLPQNFSLIHNPDAAIEVFEELNYIHKLDIRGVYFDHYSCTEIDIGASTVMDIFALNLNNYFRKRKELDFEGAYPKDTKVTCLLISSGIMSHLGVDKDARKNLIDAGITKPFNLLSGGKHTSTFRVGSSTTLKSSDGASVSDLAATRVVEYFIECLETQGFGLETEGQAYLTQIVGETINNCELHSGEFCQWFASGYYYSHAEDQCGELHLSIINFGQTIYEGLKYFSKSQRTRDELTNISKEHLDKGFFSANKWDEESLWTLYALQDGVSKEKTDNAGLDRGNGTIQLISAFQSIGGNMNGGIPEMSIISGNSYIYFNTDPISKLGPVDVGGTERYHVAFNESNDIRQPPSDKHVRKLKNYFPGTAITMRFFLDKKYIERVKKSGENF